MTENAHTDHPMRHFDRTCPACVGQENAGERCPVCESWRTDKLGCGAPICPIASPQERLAEEPSLIHATVRDAGDEFHIECRMSDGQKGAFITVDGEFPQLAGIVLDALHNHLAALRQAEAQEGWKLVPIEATPDMCLAGFDAISATPRGSTRRLHMQAVYKAMLAAAPSRTPATGEGK